MKVEFIATLLACMLLAAQASYYDRYHRYVSTILIQFTQLLMKLQSVL